MSEPDNIPPEIPCVPSTSKTRPCVVTIVLRKTKKDDKKFYRRSIINDDQDIRPVIKPPPVELTMDEIIAALNSKNPRRQFIGMQGARRLLSRERNPPIDIFIGHGIVPKCIRFLANSDNEMLKFEATWALTNIAAGTTEQTRSIIEHNGIPLLIVMLQSESIILVEQAAWTLGNIAGDGAEARDIILEHNVIDVLLRLIDKPTPLSLRRTIVWLMSNLCRNKNPPPPFEQVEMLLPALSNFLLSKDDQVRIDACWALSYVTDDDYFQIQAVINTEVVSTLVKLLDAKPNIIVPALRCIGNILTGTDSQTDVVIAAGLLPKLATLLQHPKANVVKEACWAVSNITAGTNVQIQAVLDAGIFHHLKNVLDKGSTKSKKEAAWAVTNASSSGTNEQVFSLIEDYKVLKPYMNLLQNQDPGTITVVLLGLSNMFFMAQQLGCIENFCLMVEELGGRNMLDELLLHENNEIYDEAHSIINTYYNDDEDLSED